MTKADLFFDAIEQYPPTSIKNRQVILFRYVDDKMDFFAGLFGGLSSSMPIGPINLILLEMASRRSLAAFAFVFGVILADGLLAGLSLWGSIHLLLKPSVALALGAACASLMLIYGVLSWKAKPAASVPKVSTVMAPAAVLGFGLCVLNPLFTVFWVSYILGYKEMFTIYSIGIPGFVGGLVTGDLIWFTVIGFIAIRFLSERSPLILSRLRRATSVIILLFAAYLFSVVVSRAFDI